MSKMRCEDVHPDHRIGAFTGSSGCGKSTKVANLRAQDDRFRLMISITTRAQRPTDLPGEYEYVTLDEFRRREAADQFLWTTGPLHGNYYGTMRSTVEEAISAPWPTLMHLEPRCVPQLLEAAGEVIRLFFLTVPCEQIIPRLRKRDRDQEESYYLERYEECLTWETQARQSGLPYIFVPNGDGQFDEANRQIQHILSQPRIRLRQGC